MDSSSSTQYQFPLPHGKRAFPLVHLAGDGSGWDTVLRGKAAFPSMKTIDVRDLSGAPAAQETFTTKA